MKNKSVPKKMLKTKDAIFFKRFKVASYMQGKNII